MATPVNNLLARLQQALSGTETVPPDWKPFEHFKAQFNRSKNPTRALLAAGVRSGILEMKVFRVRVRQAARPVRHYREIPSKK